MERSEIFNKVKEILKPYVKNEDAFGSIAEETSILDDLQVNSARLVDIILAFEDEFDIEVDDEAADQVSTIGNAIDLIHGQLN